MRQILKLVSCLTALTACLAFLAGFGHPAAAGTEGIPFVWQGTITATQTRLAHPVGSGAVTDRWVLTVRWKESQRIEVKDSRDRLLGWFVKLEDAGSRWQGDTTGGFEIPCPRGGTETRVEWGGDSGQGHVLTPGWGWIYYSAADDDPLAEILPNGTYAFSSSTTSTQGYTVDWLRHGCPDSMGHIDITESTRPAYLHYKIGGRYMFEPFAAPGGFNAKLLPLETVKAMASQRLKVPSAAPWDDEGRKIAKSRMQGSSQNEFHNVYRNTLSWNIARVLDLQPEIKKCQETWRPVGEGAAQGADEVSIQASVPKYPEVEGKWRFTLSEVSKEKGHCLNAGDDTGLDLEFVRGQAGFGEPKTTGAGGSSITSNSDGGASGGSDSSGASAEKTASSSSSSSSGASGTSNLPQWERGKAYAKGDAVHNNGAAYRCLTAHTSRATNEPGSGPQWQPYWAEGAGSHDSSISTSSGGGSSAGPGG
ncbi:MAG: carbohydrate-binding protein, partial [Spirochaetota bacterium]